MQDHQTNIKEVDKDQNNARLYVQNLTLNLTL